MEQSDFDVIVKSRCSKITKILAQKSKEYARGDRLSNFKKAAAAMSMEPEQLCVAFWMKHVISISDLANDIARGQKATDEMWQEKIGDAVNYPILLEALVAERANMESK